MADKYLEVMKSTKNGLTEKKNIIIIHYTSLSPVFVFIYFFFGCKLIIFV